jgi:hypothetical protein
LCVLGGSHGVMSWCGVVGLALCSTHDCSVAQ